MNKITLELTDKQAWLLDNILEEELARLNKGSYLTLYAFTKRIADKITKSLAKAKTSAT